jgi:hypothetical protein
MYTLDGPGPRSAPPTSNFVDYYLYYVFFCARVLFMLIGARYRTMCLIGQCVVDDVLDLGHLQRPDVSRDQIVAVLIRLRRATDMKERCLPPLTV